MFRVFAFFLFFAQTPEPQDMTLDRLVQSALERNPEIQGARRRWEAAQARPAQASALPNPTVSLNYWNAGSVLPGTSVGEDPASFVEPMVMQQIPFPGKRRLRGEIAQREADSVGRLYEAVRLRIGAELKRAYFDLYETERSLETIQKNRELLERFAAIARTRYEVGSGLQQDVLKAQVEATLLEERSAVLGERQQSLSARINQLLHQAPDTPLRPAREIEPSPARYALKQLYRAAEEFNPILDSKRILIDRTARRVQLARKEYLPDFNFKVGYMHFGRFNNMWDVSVSAGLPLFFWRKEARAIEETVSEFRESKNDFEATAQDLFREVKDHYLTVTTAERLARLYREAVVPQASLALESSLSAYRVGNLDFLSILNNWSILLNFELEYYIQVTRHEKALASLEQLTGLELTQSGGGR